jgi:hypothetical protein
MSNSFLKARAKFRAPKTNIIRLNRHLPAKAIGQVRPVNFIEEIRDFECIHLASLGFSDTVIMRETGLSKGQISYRMKRAGVKRVFYRNGMSEIGRMVVKKTRAFVEQKLTPNLRLVAGGEAPNWLANNQKKSILSGK